jgi:ATP adenylyltransferase
MLAADIRDFNGSTPVRFSKVLSSTVQDELSLPSDVVVHRDNNLIVCPTLGSFLPNWYLIMPTQHKLNFADWEKDTNGRSTASEVQRIVKDVLWDGDYIWFEHGPSRMGSTTGCGVDHAHVHVILESGFGVDDVLRASAELGVRNWDCSNFGSVFEGRREQSEYLAFGNSCTGYLKNLNQPAGSQFFRRVLANLDGYRSDWDYKLYAHHEIAQKSVDRVLTEKVSELVSE